MHHMHQEIRGRRERKRAATRGQIIGAAMSLFAERDYEGVTIDEITERADVAKGTFYLHFRTKEDLASDVYNDLIRPAAEEIDKTIPSERSSLELLTALFRVAAIPAEANPRLARAVFSHGMSQAYAERPGSEDAAASLFTAVLEKIVSKGQKSGELRGDVKSWELTIMLSVLYATTVWMWAGTPAGDSLTDRLQRCLQTSLEGMVASR